jgi:hypothetical protein
MINILKNPLGPFPYQQQPIRVDLNAGVNIHSFIGRVSGLVTIAGGASSGTVNTESVMRLIRAIRIVHDGEERVQRISGRDLWQMTGRNRLFVPAPQVLANGDVQANTPISFNFELAIAYPQLAQPALVFWPGYMPVRQELAMYIEWETGIFGGAGSAPGSAALVSGTFDRVLTFSNLTLDLWQQYSTGLYRPDYLARISIRDSDQFSAANPNLPLRLTGARRFTGALFRSQEGPLQDSITRINRLSFQAAGGSLNYWNLLPFAQLQAQDSGLFPASVDVGQNGTYFAHFVDNGLLGGAVDPRPLSDPRFVFDVAAPGTNPGFVHSVFLELDTMPGVTNVQN